MAAIGAMRHLPRRKIILVHRWLSLAAALFWLLQAVTGTLIVFHWELRDWIISDVHRATDLPGIERRLEVIAPPGGAARIDSIWTSGGQPDRYDVFYTSRGGQSLSVRIAGDGTVLRAPGVSDGALLDTLVGLHHNLLAGEAGDWILGASGLLLVTNLFAGFVLARPGNGRWRTALKPAGKGGSTASLYSWHRATGLWLLVPLLLIVASGTLLKFPAVLASVPGSDAPSLPPVPTTGKPVGFGRATSLALATLRGSTLTSVSFPTVGDATYRVLLRTPEEMRRAYGASLVLINANTGSLRGSFPITRASAGRRLVSAVIPIHTAQAAGPIGRFFLLLLGVGLSALIAFGLLLWVRRRPKKRITR